MVNDKKKNPLFFRILPGFIRGNIFLYNTAVIILSLASGFICFVLSAAAAMLLAWIISEKLNAGIAGMSILLVFMSAAVFIAAVVTLLLLIKNISFDKE